MERRPISTVKPVFFALTENELHSYERDVYIKRRLALNRLEDYIVNKIAEDWLPSFSYLAEYISILFHFENLLEGVQNGSQWDAENNQWLLDEEMGMRFLVYYESLLVCTRALVEHNISLSVH